MLVTTPNVGSSGTVAVDRGYTATAISQRLIGNFTSTTATYTAGWNGAVTLGYNYLAHGQVSFDPGTTNLAQTLNFGTWLAGSGPQTQSFDVYNRQLQPIAGNQISIDLNGVTGIGNTGALSTDLVGGVSLQNVAAGSSGSGTATFDTSATGSYSAQYTLGFGDDSAAPGAAPASLFGSTTPVVGSNYIATLDLVGSVVDHAAPSFTNVSNPLDAVTDLALAMGIGGAGPSTTFDIFNLLGDRVGLEFAGCGMSGDTAAFTIGLCGLPAGSLINPGDFFASTASFDMSVPKASATYDFVFVDNTAGGINGTPLFYDLTLNISGVGNAQSVPEPGTLALLGAGIFGMWRRRNRAV